MPGVMEYTLAQVRAFLAAIERHTAIQDMRLLRLMATATRGDASQLEAVLRQLAQTAA